MHSYYSHGKLLITGEYAVLDGALSLALPTRKGQWLHTFPQKEKGILWQSFDKNGKIWFENYLFGEENAKNSVQITLEKILLAANNLNPNFKITEQNARIETHLEFERDWGLGSSSTLINNIAQWAKVDAYQLLQKSFGGSGYDIACAKTPYAILYQLKEKNPFAYPVSFSPSFSDQIFFIHLNQKQNSKEGIKLYKQTKKDSKSLIESITKITEEIIRTDNLSIFEKLISEHEIITSNTIGIPTIKQQLFSDFKGALKSLGAWGGDFIMAIGNIEYINSYFKDKEYRTIIPFCEMII